MYPTIRAGVRLLGLGLTAIAAVAFTAAPASAQGEESFEGVVIKDKVEVRAGASQSDYVVGEVTKGTKVTVASMFLGWCQIVPPPGVASYISRMSVDAKGDGKTGVVNDASPAVFAASVNGFGESVKAQLRLHKGDTVHILAQDGSYYRISPPPGALVFLPRGSIERVTPPAAAPAPAAPAPATATATPAPAAPVSPAPKEELSKDAAPAPPAPAATTPTPTPFEGSTTTAPPAAPAPKEELSKDAAPVTPAPPAAGNPEAPAPAPAAPAAPRGPQVAHAQSPSVQAAEARLAQAATLPLEKQPLDELMAVYQNLSHDNTLPTVDRRIVAIRIAQLRVAKDRADAIKSLKSARESNTSVISVTPAPAPTPGVYDPSIYNAFGQLLASPVYDGQTGPRLFRLVDPASLRTIGYVQPGRYDPSHYLGKLVGIVGKNKFDPALRLQIIEVERMDILNAGPGQGGVTAPKPAPTAETMPAPKTAEPNSAPAATQPEEQMQK